jgi:hypothetical protein
MVRIKYDEQNPYSAVAVLRNILRDIPRDRLVEHVPDEFVLPAFVGGGLAPGVRYCLELL